MLTQAPWRLAIGGTAPGAYARYTPDTRGDDKTGTCTDGAAAAGRKGKRNHATARSRANSRAPLAGEKAYDIDCENGDFRLIWSLACQEGKEGLVSIVWDYIENREAWLQQIAQSNPRHFSNQTKWGGKRIW